MSGGSIKWRAQARTDLLSIYDWIADEAGPAVAMEYTSKIEAYVDRLRTFPHRGSPQAGGPPGLRTLTYRRRTIIAYKATGDGVEILRVFHAAQDRQVE